MPPDSSAATSDPGGVAPPISRARCDLRGHQRAYGPQHLGSVRWVGDEAVVAGDVAMLAGEVTPVLKAMREAGLQIVAIHHHMTGDPTIYFLHYWGRGPAARLAQGVRAAVDLLGKK